MMMPWQYRNKKVGSWIYRHKVLMSCVCVMIAIYAQRLYSHKAVVAVTLSCNQPLTLVDETILTLPQTHYLFSDTYGWFDRSHFNAGQPGKVLMDVRMAVINGGGMITISQGVRGNITGYTATYYISPHLNAIDVTAAALGIYLDWSTRFEEWQAQPPHGLVGPLTPFAIEDLPSQYLGFYAQAHGMSLDQLFACYLGPVSGSEEGPPGFAMIDEPDSEDSWAGIVRLQNRSFTPFVETESGWQYVDWPEPLQMTSIDSSRDTWQFVSEETWYLGDEIMEPQTEEYPLHSYRPQHLK